MNQIANFRIARLRAVPTLFTSATTAGNILANPVQIAALPINWQGELVNILVIDAKGNNAKLDVVLLGENQSLGTLGSAPRISAANAGKILTVATVEAFDYRTLGSGLSVAVAPVNATLTAASGEIWVALIDRTGGKTYAASDLTVVLDFRTDNPL
jgi:hypothetical protein